MATKRHKNTQKIAAVRFFVLFRAFLWLNFSGLGMSVSLLSRLSALPEDALHLLEGRGVPRH
jgi:hypothetical protein